MDGITQIWPIECRSIQSILWPTGCISERFHTMISNVIENNGIINNVVTHLL